MRKYLTEEQKQERRKQRAERNKQLDAQGKQIEQIVSVRYGERIAEQLKAKRKEKGYTQEEFAKLLGISKDSLMDYEKTGELKYPTRVFLSMCEALDCSPQNLMGIDEAHHRETQAIMDVTGLSEDAIELLKGFNDYRKSLESEGQQNRNQEALNRAADYGLIIDFISFMITHMDFDIMVRHIKSLAINSYNEQHSDKFDSFIDNDLFEIAMERQTDDDKAYLAGILGIAQLLEKVENHSKGNAIETEWKFSQMASNVLSDFTKEQMPIALEQIEREVQADEKR